MIKWLKHASFKISNKKVIYIDPWEIREEEKADLILITHEHYDHCSPEDIEKLKKEETVIIASFQCQGKISGAKFLKPGKKVKIEEIEVETVPAYNLNKPYHPKENNGLGFIVTFEGERIYHAGDTDFISEMRELKNIDIALLPVSGTYVMTLEEAVQAANAIKPKLAIPMHYGKIVGSIEDAQRFKELYKGKTEIL